MPEKTVREMSTLERKRYSLSAKMFRATVMGCALLGLVLLVIGLGLYSVSLTRQYVSHAFYLSQTAAQSAGRGADSAEIAGQVMEIYRGLSEEERAQTGTEEYRARFAAVKQTHAYHVLVSMLPAFMQSDDVSAVYLAMYDEDTCAMVYIVDPDPDDPLHPGDWESVNEKGMRKFLDWDGQGMLYDIGRPENYGWMCTAGTPIRGEDGEIACYALVDVTVENILDGLRAYALQITVAILLVMLLISWLVLRHMKKTLVNPINEIARAAQDYVADKKAGVKETDHFAMLNIRTGDEVENLSLVMADMERDLTEYVEDLTRVTAEKQRVTTELSMATQIQEGMLPNIYPAFPDRPEFDIYATMAPAREVGGDFYDFFLVDDDHLCMVMADVSGKGVPAALFMMASKIILANNAVMGKSPAQILTDTNTAICSNNKMEMFVTVWLGILEISTGKLTAANGGHEYPALRHADGPFELCRDRHGLVIGAMEGVRYRQYELQLAPGDKLFLYTDGVPEATDADNTLFGTDRMLCALNTARDKAPQEILKTVRAAVDSFVNAAEQFDDLTMLCLEYRGGGQREERDPSGES